MSLIKYNLIQRASTSAGVKLSPKSSRCIRLRYYKNTCDKCITACKANAISIDDTVIINESLCTNCGMCSVVCPSGCFDNPEMFYRMFSELRKIASANVNPVLGCLVDTNPSIHVRVPCLGYLSKEQLIFLYLLLPCNIQLNVSSCASCVNLHASKKIFDYLSELQLLFKNFSTKVKLVDKKDEISYRAVTFDRRGFFKTLKEMALCKTSDFFIKNDNNEQISYTEKSLPLKQDLLNKIVALHNTEDIARGFFYSLKIKDKCSACQGCAGMCPTGAIKAQSDEDNNSYILFYCCNCTGCGLCISFCPDDAIELKLGTNLTNINKPQRFSVAALSK